jgi:hypothetical protein
MVHHLIPQTKQSGNAVWTAEEYLGQCALNNNEEVVMIVCKWLQTQEPDFYNDCT